MCIIQDFATFHGISFEYSRKIIGNRDARCKCGEFKNLRNTTRGAPGTFSIGHTCGRKQCSPAYGKKRPEHSRKMKNLAINGSDEYKSTLMKKGEVFNKEVNSISFKRKVLTRKGYSCGTKTDDEIVLMFSEYASNKNKTVARRKREIVLRFNTWESEYQKLILIITNNIVPTEEWVDELTNDQLQYMWKRIHGVNTIRNNSKVLQTRSTWFKREIFADFKFNNSQNHVCTKSGWEGDYVRFFEDNGIMWSYEPIILETVKKDGFHIPDFLIVWQGNKILLEIKGDFYRQDKDEYIFNKVGAAIEYANANNIRYVLTQCLPDQHGKFLSNALIDTKRID